MFPNPCWTTWRRGLEETRWPDEIPGSDWDYGTNMAYLRSLVDYWRTRVRVEGCRSVR